MAGVLLAFATRGVSDEFNESKCIALAIYNLVSVLLIILPILVVIQAVGDTQVILLLFLIVWIATFTLGALFVTKVVAFLTTSSTTPVSRRRSQSSGSGQQFSFLSLSNVPTAATLLPYLAALAKHAAECQRLLAQLRQKESATLKPAPTPPPARAAAATWAAESQR